jgi:hypothetical protein
VLTPLCAVRLPNADRAIISEQKLQGYLLCSTHPVGRFKAEFFFRLGYTPDDWQLLESDIRRLLREDAEKVEDTVYGRKYVVRATLTGPAGSAKVVTVWILPSDEDCPRLITAYPES